MTRALVTQMLEALEKLSDTEQTYAALDKADAVIKAAREYLADELSGERSRYKAAHQSHCYQGEYEGTCKYGDDDCQAKQPDKSVTEPIGERADSAQWLREFADMEFSYYSREATQLRKAADMLEADAQPATPDIKALQAKGKGPAPCARFCEANAFQIEIRRLTAEINAQQAKRVPLNESEDLYALALKADNWGQP